MALYTQKGDPTVLKWIQHFPSFFLPANQIISILIEINGAQEYFILGMNLNGISKSSGQDKNSKGLNF